MKLVVLTGAGAGRADGIPLQAELFGSFFGHAFNDPHLTGLATRLRLFFERCFGTEVASSQPQWPTFEEALGVLDIAIAREDGIGSHAFGTDIHSGALTDLRRDLILALTAEVGIPRRDGPSVHAVLVANLRQLGLMEEVTFVTTNYDTLIDAAIESAAVEGERGTGSLVDYGFRDLNGGPIGPNDDDRRFKCLKIHGSLNWLYCPVCDQLSITYGTEGVTRLLTETDGAKCSQCETVRTPVIVPPSYYKNVTNPYLSIVAAQTQRALRGARHVVVCGYSFPDADLHLKYLIKRAQLNRDTATSPLKISVANHFPGKDAAVGRAELDRFVRLLGRDAVIDTGLSFEEFADDPLPTIDS